MSFDYFADDPGPESADPVAGAQLVDLTPRDHLGKPIPVQPPANIEAEQALLGAMLCDPDVLHHLPDGFQPIHFWEPFHARLFHRIQVGVQRGERPEAWSISQDFNGDQAWDELGGVRYLADLVDRAPPSVNAPEYGRAIMDCALRRDMILMAKKLVAQAYTGRDDDGDPITAQSLAEEVEGELQVLQLASTTATLTDAPTASQQVMDHLDQDPRDSGMLTTGCASLDLAMGPMLPGDLVLLGGRPGMGKSTLAAAMALHIAGPDLALLDPSLGEDDLWRMRQQLAEPMGVISINGEMPVKQSTWRMLAAIGFQMYGPKAPTYNAIRNRQLTDEHRAILREAKQQWDRLPIFQTKRTGIRLSQVRSLARRQKALLARQGIKLGLVAIDHVGLVKAEGRATSEYEAQSQVARGSKELADELDCAVMGLVQLSRDVEKRDDKRPQLSDLRASGQWEENADVVLLAYREAYYAQHEKEPADSTLNGQQKWADWDRRRKSKTLEVILGKVRDGGGGHNAELWCDIGRNALRTAEPQFSPALFGGR